MRQTGSSAFSDSLIYAEVTAEFSEPESWVYDFERKEADRIASKFKVPEVPSYRPTLGSDIPVLETDFIVQPSEDPRYVNLVETALGLFPVGRVKPTELRRRITQINTIGRPLGFRLQDYGEIPEQGLWNYVTKTVQELISSFARDHCPTALERVVSQNRQRLQERRNIRNLKFY